MPSEMAMTYVARSTLIRALRFRFLPISGEAARALKLDLGQIESISIGNDLHPKERAILYKVFDRGEIRSD